MLRATCNHSYRRSVKSTLFSENWKEKKIGNGEVDYGSAKKNPRFFLGFSPEKTRIFFVCSRLRKSMSKSMVL